MDEARVILSDLQHVGNMRVGTSTRAQIDDAVRLMIRNLSRLLTFDWDSRPEVRALIEAANRQLEVPRRPNTESTTHYAFNWLRDSATVGARLANLHKGGPTEPPGTRAESSEAHDVRIGDFYEARPGLFYRVVDMTTPKVGVKTLRFANGRTAVVSGLVDVWRPVERVSSAADTYGPPPYAPAR
ncbi:hypothetical protein [Streptomyces roseolus]|uniref:hypothetical protein n=1 Tax=Streptomyces roseolus TaxID=67358 RepID=UPI001674BEBE|nr:hypothetical protein [Streptomyces roseolus]GGR52192.1 hypothetical protein GCM10010282_51540 [Streptomyces roseolus]